MRAPSTDERALRLADTATTEFDPTEFLDDARRVARTTAYQWPGIDAEDLTGELSLKLVENSRSFAKAENARALVNASLKRWAGDYCRQERVRAMQGTAHYLYGTDEAGELLAAFFLCHDAWPDASSGQWPPGEKGKDGSGQTTAVVDVGRAWEQLSDTDRTTLYTVHNAGYEAAAETAGVTSRTLRVRYSRALGTLTERMNFSRAGRAAQYEGTGARSALSNAQARVLTGQR
ncbi:RNA polymerase sigma factor [Streptomyces sp. NPDC050507]|uniref:RNA polymerase sigma factor n=1 Tax=Streptomyces sp. NPDC050507 TaxID=3365619 RepID=UPI0037B5451F